MYATCILTFTPMGHLALLLYGFKRCKESEILLKFIQFPLDLFYINFNTNHQKVFFISMGPYTSAMSSSLPSFRPWFGC